MTSAQITAGPYLSAPVDKGGQIITPRRVHPVAAALYTGRIRAVEKAITMRGLAR